MMRNKRTEAQILELADLYEQQFLCLSRVYPVFFVLNLSYTTVFGINVKIINFNFSAELIVLSLSEQT
jgi:hypothetical protein